MKDRIREILEKLTERYPDAKIELNFTNPLELTIATILSAQCTDVRVNIVTADLFRKYTRPEDYLAVLIEELEDDIRTTGFFRNKAKSIRGCCQGLIERHGGKVPNSMEALLQLPGIGRKTANVILGNSFGVPGMVVDTHVKRISNRLGLSQNDDPERIETDLCAIIPQEMWTQASHLFIFHGRRTCAARNPQCKDCVIYDYCSWEGKK